MKGDLRHSIFPLKLLMVYVAFIGLIPTLDFFLDINNDEALTDDWDWDLGWSLILCVPLLATSGIAAWNFRQMPRFAALMILVAGWHIVITLIDYYQMGFDDRFGIELQPRYFFRAALVFAVPFLLAYLAWFFWPRLARSRFIALVHDPAAS